MSCRIWIERGKKRVQTASRRKRFFDLAREARSFACGAFTGNELLVTMRGSEDIGALEARELVGS